MAEGARTVTGGSGKYELRATLTFCGEDLLVSVTGGTRPHIGACAMAVPRESLKKDGSVSATASVLCNMGHKDDEPARRAALYLASHLERTVCVTCGIHVDDAEEKDLKAFLEAFEELLARIEAAAKEEL